MKHEGVGVERRVKRAKRGPLLPPTQSSLPLYAGIQFSCDSSHVFNDVRKWRALNSLEVASCKNIKRSILGHFCCLFWQKILGSSLNALVKVIFLLRLMHTKICLMDLFFCLCTVHVWLLGCYDHTADISRRGLYSAANVAFSTLVSF